MSCAVCGARSVTYMASEDSPEEDCSNVECVNSRSWDWKREKAVCDLDDARDDRAERARYFETGEVWS